MTVFHSITYAVVRDLVGAGEVIGVTLCFNL